MKKRFTSMGIIADLVVLVLSGLPDSAPAEFNVNINIGSPPVVVAEPAEVVLIPGMGVHFVPNGDTDLFFYAGFWWSPRGDRWYRAEICNGPWVVVKRHVVPVQVIRVPRDYRVRYGKAKHIPYGQWKKTHHRKTADNDQRSNHQNRKASNKKWK